MNITETQMDKDLRDIADLSLQLHQLANDPHPGLFTWMEAFAETALSLSAILVRAGMKTQSEVFPATR